MPTPNPANPGDTPLSADDPHAGAKVTGTTEDRLVSRNEMCDILGVTYPTVWKLIKEGRFPRGRYIGQRAFWLLSEIDAFIASLPRYHQMPAARIAEAGDAPTGRRRVPTGKGHGRGRPRKLVPAAEVRT